MFWRSRNTCVRYGRTGVELSRNLASVRGIFLSLSHRGVSTVALSQQDQMVLESIVTTLQDSRHIQPSALNDMVLKLPNRYDLAGFLARSGKLDETRALLDHLEPTMTAFNLFNMIAANDFDLTQHETRVARKIVKKLMLNQLTFQDCQTFKDLDMNDPLVMTSILLRTAVRSSQSQLATSIMKHLLGAGLAGEDTKKISTVINQENMKLLINFLLIKDPRHDIQNVKEVFYLLSQCDKFITKANNKHGLQLTMYSLDKSQVASIVEKASTAWKKDPQAQKSYIEVREIVVRELGAHISRQVDVLPAYGSNDVRSASIVELNQQEKLDMYLKFCYEFIENRIRYKDPASVYATWSLIKPFHNKLYNSNLNSANNNSENGFYYYDIMAKLISCFSKNKRYTYLVRGLIADLPVNAIKVSPNLMSALIFHSARTKNFELGNLLMEQYNDKTLGLPTRYSSNQLSALLSLSLQEGRYERAKEILAFARENLIKFDAAEFNELVRAALQTEGNEEAAWAMITGSSASTARYAYISYLNCMISRSGMQMDFEKIEYMFQQAIKSVSPSDLHFWDYWNLAYFKYINRKEPLQVAIGIYNTSVQRKSIFRNLSDLNYSVNPFTTRHDKVKFKFSAQIKPLILRDIFQRAVTHYKKALHSSSKTDLADMRLQLKHVSIWCFKRFKELGYRDSTIVVDMLKTVNAKHRAVGFQIAGSESEFGPVTEQDLEAIFVRNLQEYESSWRAKNSFNRRLSVS